MHEGRNKRRGVQGSGAPSRRPRPQLLPGQAHHELKHFPVTRALLSRGTGHWDRVGRGSDLGCRSSEGERCERCLWLEGQQQLAWPGGGAGGLGGSPSSQGAVAFIHFTCLGRTSMTERHDTVPPFCSQRIDESAPEDGVQTLRRFQGRRRP